MQIEEILIPIITAILTGAIASMTTIASIKVHIQYLREAINRAHDRIDNIEKHD